MLTMDSRATRLGFATDNTKCEHQATSADFGHPLSDFAHLSALDQTLSGTGRSFVAGFLDGMVAMLRFRWPLDKRK